MPLMPEDVPLLSVWLSEKRGGKVNIAVPKQGIKKKLIEMAEENARIHSLSMKDSGKAVCLKRSRRNFIFRAYLSLSAPSISRIWGGRRRWGLLYTGRTESLKNSATAISRWMLLKDG